MVQQRKFPYPYKAMLAIVSDIDYCTVDRFEWLHTFLNTKENVKGMGEGVGLDVGDSFWMYNKAKYLMDLDPPQEPQPMMQHTMSYWAGVGDTAQDKANVLKYLRTPWIDSCHAYGDFSRTPDQACTREKAQRCYDEWAAEGITSANWSHWIDHGDIYNYQNIFPAWGYGDRGVSDYYHADLLKAFGVKYIWQYGSNSYGDSTLLTPLTLRDGSKMWGYPRLTDNWHANKIQNQLTETIINNLKANGHYLIVGQHLGISNVGDILTVTEPPFTAAGCLALRRLQYEHENGEVLVARGERILRYNLAEQFLEWTYDEGANRIIISAINDPQFGPYIPALDDIRGVTFEGPEITDTTTVWLNDAQIASVSYPAAGVVMVDWFAADHTDYADGRWVEPKRRYYQSAAVRVALGV